LAGDVGDELAQDPRPGLLLEAVGRNEVLLSVIELGKTKKADPVSFERKVEPLQGAGDPSLFVSVGAAIG
jgi:hypothetical protein